MKKHEHIVKKVQSGSIAEELGIEPGDQIAGDRRECDRGHF